MHPNSLDHIALYVPDRDALARELVDALEVHVIDRTDRYTLVGASATSGKLTLFDPPTAGVVPLPSRIVSVMLADTAPNVRQPMVTSAGLTITFGMHEHARVASVPRHSLIGVTFRSADPPIVAAEYCERFGFAAGSVHRDVATISVGNGVATLVRERCEQVEQPMLNHLGLLVDSAQQHIEEAERRGVDVLNVVDAPNTLAVFVDGPEHVQLEFVEHKQEFALA